MKVAEGQWSYKGEEILFITPDSRMKYRCARLGTPLAASIRPRRSILDMKYRVIIIHQSHTLRLGLAVAGMALTFPPSPSPSPPFSSAYLPSPSSSSSPSLFTVYLSRWNNANAEPFNRRRRAQEQIESEIRLHRRFSSAQSILPPSTSLPPSSPSLHFKSHGSPSSPSSPSIPGRFSKYSKPPPDYSHTNGNHPAFRKIRPRPVPPPVTAPDGEDPIRVSEKGVSYKLKDAPFEFQYSYTETPKVKPLALREPPFLPFGPKDTPRPWTGRAPLPPSKKKLPEFDSFKLPPPGKKGVKPVQSPGPFLAGSGGPRYTAASREEILGEPLSEEEVAELVKGCLKTKRQLNMGILEKIYFLLFLKFV